MVGRLLEKCVAETALARRAGGGGRDEPAGRADRDRARRRRRPAARIGRRSRHRRGPLRRRPVARRRARRARAGRCRCRTRTPGSCGSTRTPRARRRACSRCSPPTTCRARTTSASREHDEPLFPTEVCFAGQAVAWVIAETEEQARVAAGLGPGRLRGAAGDPVDRGGHRRRTASSPPAIGCQRGDAEAALRDAPHRLDGELRIGGQEHFYLETNAALAYRDRRRRAARPLVDAAPDRDAGDRRARARPAEARGGRAVPADGRRVRRQGSAGQRLGGGGGAGRDADLKPAGARPADAPAGHGADRQAPPVPGALPRRLRRQTARCARSPSSCSATAAGRST